MAKKPTSKKATKKATIEALVKTAGKGLEKIDNKLATLVFDAFHSRNYVRYSRSGMTFSAEKLNSYEYTYVFEVDESYYRISHFSGTSMYTIGPDEGFDKNSVEIRPTAKSIREAVENFERNDSGEEEPEERKYKFTGETKEVDGHTLHRIRAVRKFTDPNVDDWVINKGDLGGWIESEKNLSHDGAAWVNHDACVYGEAKVYGNGYVRDSAKVYGRAEVSGNAVVYENAVVYGHAEVYGGAEVCGHANVYDGAKVYDHAEVYDYAEVCGRATVFENALVYDNARVYGDAVVRSDGWVGGNDKVYGNTVVGGTDTDEPDNTTEPETEDTLKRRMTVLEGRVDKLADEMKATVKDIKAIKKKLNM